MIDPFIRAFLLTTQITDNFFQHLDALPIPPLGRHKYYKRNTPLFQSKLYEYLHIIILLL